MSHNILSGDFHHLCRFFVPYQVTSFIVFIFYCSGDGEVLQNTFKEETVFFVFPALDFIFRNVAYEGYDIISVEVDHAHCDI